MIKTTRFAGILLLLLLYSGGLWASHIVGGDISYRCLGYDASTNTNQYEITMKIYRNCNRFAMDVFSDPAPITIYRTSMFGRYDSIQHVYVPLGRVIDVPPPDNPCLVLPPDICVEEGDYQFRVRLPVSDQTYVIAYQRCCRNATINNIRTPDRTGATYSVEISPESQRVCNNSPVFNEFPPIVICANQPLNFDHSATDPEGDQIVYEFCSALEGGGVVGAFVVGDPEGCDGFRPDPACPPPYNTVNYIGPTYTATRPMPGDPMISIDPNTGLITGIPNQLGQFVVGVCVKEFRGGVLLSSIQRDFQFNVANCEPVVDARIAQGEEISDQQYVIRSCGATEVLIENVSVQRNNIDNFFWLFDINGQDVRINEWDALVAFPDTGTYMGQLILNLNSDCGDTANVIVHILPSIEADFTYDYDTCVAGDIAFTDRSVTEGDRIEEWNWRFESGRNSNEQHPDYRFSNAGIYQVGLAVRDNNGCVDEVEKEIEWFPAPELLIVEPTAFEGCEPMTVFFNNLSNPITEEYTILWDFGDGGTSDEISPTHIYENVGVYDVSLTVISPLGCRISEDWSNLIEVFPTPVADFDFTPDRPSNFNPEVQFTDRSIDAVEWLWNFGGEGLSIQQNPTYLFPDTGIHIISLVVTHLLGCKDTLEQLIDVEPQIRFFLPNAFTPNDDTVNDGFKGKGFFDGMTNFSMVIYNRWGELIFETQDPDESWNGRKFNSGSISPNGVYVCLVQFNDPRGNRTQIEGVATLIR